VEQKRKSEHARKKALDRAYSSYVVNERENILHPKISEKGISVWLNFLDIITIVVLHELTSFLIWIIHLTLKY